MDVVHPLAGNLAQSASIVQRQQSAGKAQQIRREQALRKDATVAGDRFDHTVESTDAASPAHDEHPDQRRRQSHPEPDAFPARGDDAPPHIDVTV